jgi:hypothetical protein
MQNRTLLEKEKREPINWQRGMFRLWIVASTAWMMGWLIYLAIEFVGGEASARDLMAAPVMLLGPPIALLLFAFATRWAFRGFEV